MGAAAQSEIDLLDRDNIKKTIGANEAQRFLRALRANDRMFPQRSSYAIRLATKRSSSTTITLVPLPHRHVEGYVPPWTSLKKRRSSHCRGREVLLAAVLQGLEDTAIVITKLIALLVLAPLDVV